MSSLTRGKKTNKLVFVFWEEKKKTTHKANDVKWLALRPRKISVIARV